MIISEPNYTPATKEDITKRVLTEVSSTWKLSPAFVTRYLSAHYLLKWQSSYLLSQLQGDADGSSYIHRQGKDYHLVSSIPKAANLLVSFRATNNPDLPNVILLKEARS